ncbi:MAG: hypothetical protein ACI4WW_03675 [Candidatus Coprovivens sp.]
MQTNMTDEQPSTDTKRFEEMLFCPYRLYSDETLTDKDYIEFYDYVMRKFKEHPEGFDIKDPIFEVRDYLELFPAVQEYMCAKAEEGLTKEDKELIDEIVMKLEQRRKVKRNPFKQFIKSLKG